MQSDTSTTTERLLNTAERLFAEYGYDGVGMRALADVAGVNLGAATYHYGSKEKLYIETFMRRFRPVEAERLELLRQAQATAKGKPISVEKIVDCMIRPPFLCALKHPNFPALLARNLFMPPPFMQEFLLKELAPHTEPFVAVLAQALPKLPPDILRMRVMFSGGALLMFVGQLGKMPGPMSGDRKFVEFALKELVRFIATGLQSQPSSPVPPKLPLPFTMEPPRL